MNDATRAAFDAVRQWDCHELERLLTAGGVDVNAYHDRGYTLLQGAKDFDSARLLLRAGARVNAQTPESKSTALHYAAWRSTTPTVLIAELLAAGADVNAQDFRGRTALMLTVSMPVAVLLLKTPEIDLDVRANNGRMAADFHCLRGRFDIAEAIEAAEAARRRRWSADRAAWLGAVLRAGVARFARTPAV